MIKCEPFKVDDKVIPGLHNNPLRTLGRTYEVDEKTLIISDKVRRKEVKVKLEEGIETLDRCRTKGVQKCWALHHVLLYHIRWNLMIYEIPLFFIETLETFVSKFIIGLVSVGISQMLPFIPNTTLVFFLLRVLLFSSRRPRLVLRCSSGV